MVQYSVNKTQQIYMENPFASKHYWVLSAIMAAIIFIFFINSNRIYKTESELLIISKNERTDLAMDQVISNVTQIPFTLSFYNRVLDTNREIMDENPMASSNNRKKYWQSLLKVERVGDSGVVKITTFHKNGFQAEMLNEQVLDGLISDIGRYYDIRTDIDARILDTMITSQISAGNIFYQTSMSLLLAIILSAFVYYFLVYIYQWKNSRAKISKPSIYFTPIKKNQIKSNVMDPFNYFSFPFHDSKNEAEPEVKKSIKPIKEEGSKPENQAINAQPEPLNKLDQEIKNTEQETREYTKAEKTIDAPSVSFGSKKGHAPGNLPVADAGAIFEVKKNLYPKEAKKEEIKEEIIHEPTPEEVKERLNKLLSGNF